jgi:hypothetical protein
VPSNKFGIRLGCDFIMKLATCKDSTAVTFDSTVHMFIVHCDIKLLTTVSGKKSTNR